MTELVHDARGGPQFFNQKRLTLVRCKNKIQTIGSLIAKCYNYIRIGDIVYERYMFVADPLDIVLTEAVIEHRRAFKSFNSHNFSPIIFFQSFTSTECSS